MAPEDHAPDVVRLVHVLFVFQYAVDPTGHRDTRGFHQFLGGEPAQQVIVIDVPDTRPMLPRASRQSVVPRQRVGQNAHVGRALDVVVATENIGAATRRAHVAQSQLQDAVCTRIVVAVGVLRAAHAPNHGAGAIVGKGPGDAAKLGTGNAGHPFGLFGIPLFDFRPDLVQPPDALTDELLVFPAVLENMPENAPDQGNVGARPHLHEFVGMGGRAGETRIANNERRVLLFLGL